MTSTILPLTRDFSISDLHRFTSSYYSRSGWAADVTTASGDRLVVSKYDDETEWVADGFYRAEQSWFPVYWNGEGSRCTLLKAPTSAIQAALNDAVRRAV